MTKVENAAEFADADHSPPLITFMLLAYNQEKYVRKAIEGALVQTYEPLEILLSDDCSTDRTFEIMTEMAAAYRGPHRVTVVQNPVNMGVFAHNLARGQQASGELVVAAAGDDISLPHRTARLAEAFGPGVACVFSRVAIINADGEVTADVAEGPGGPLVAGPVGTGKVRPLVRDDDRDTGSIHGASAAYRKWVYSLPITPSNNTFAEDYFFYNYLVLAGARVIRLTDVLVLWRSHAASMSRGAGQHAINDPVAEDIAITELSRRRFDMVGDLMRIADILGASSDKFDMPFLEQFRFIAKIRIDWPALSFWQRVGGSLSVISMGRGDSNRQLLKWCALRLWGRYPAYQPKGLIARFQRKYRPYFELASRSGDQ